MSKLKIMTHVVAGYRTFSETAQLVQIMSEEGVDYIEIQIPFSDPIGDGSVITQANHYAIEHGANTEKSWLFIEKIAKQVQTPLLIMTYANIPYRYGMKQFFERAKSLEVKALIIPDLPFGEAERETAEAIRYSKEYEISLVPVISPNTTAKRMELIAKQLKKAADPLMIYCTRRTGITGTQQNQIEEQQPVNDRYIATVRKHFSTQVAAGFGLSSPEQVKGLEGSADIAVIGSHIIRMFSAYEPQSEEGFNKVREFIQTITS